MPIGVERKKLRPPVGMGKYQGNKRLISCGVLLLLPSQTWVQSTACCEGSDNCSDGSYECTPSETQLLPWGSVAPHLFVSFCGASFFVGSDFFRAKSWDPHVPLALCKGEASREIRTWERQHQGAVWPSDKGLGDKSEQSIVLSNSSPVGRLTPMLKDRRRVGTERQS